MTDRVAFAAHHRSLLQLEREAEVAENERLLQQCSDAELVARGATLLRLEVADLEPGFGGRLHATLRPTRGGELPQHRFGPGDVVAMRSARDDDARPYPFFLAQTLDVGPAGLGPREAWQALNDLSLFVDREAERATERRHPRSNGSSAALASEPPNGVRDIDS